MSEAEVRAAIIPSAGRITAAASATLAPGISYRLVGGRITSKVVASLVTPPTDQFVGGTITSTVRARVRAAQTLQGTITAAVSASLGIGLAPLPYYRISGTVTVALKLTAAPTVSIPPGVVTGSIFSAVISQLDDEAVEYVAPVAGATQITVSLWGTAGPWQPILVGGIFAAVHALMADAEVETPPPPYPPAFPTYDVDHYLDLVTSEHNQRPKYMETVGITVDPIVGDQELVANFPGLFDLDYCVGQQEDFTGQWIGKSRWIELPSVFFTWDEEGLGWNQANWRGPGDADSSLERLDDYHYRLLLYANIIANHWNGSVPGAYEAWDTLFQYVGIKVIIQDYGNMTMLYGFMTTTAPDAVLLSLFTTGQMDLRPEGIELRAYALQAIPNIPFFAWDASSDSVQGWDGGQWAKLLPPGEAYIPGVGMMTYWDVPSAAQGRSTDDTPQTHWDGEDGVPTVWDH